MHARATVVSSGLVAHYNAANSSSYSGTGNRLNNLANTGFATLFNNPTYNASGSPFLSFNGINQYFFTENLTNFFPGAIGSKTNAISAGSTHTDWHLNNPGNRVLNKLIIR